MHVPIADTTNPSDWGFHPSVEEGCVHSIHSIELDCSPGGIRPWDLILAVIEGAGLTTDKVGDKHPPAFFGHCEWRFPNISCKRWGEIQEITRPRIQSLYASGAIRFGSW